MYEVCKFIIPALEPEIISATVYKLYVSGSLINNGKLNGYNLRIYLGGTTGGAVYNEANGNWTTGKLVITDTLSHAFKSEGIMFFTRELRADSATLVSAGNISIDSTSIYAKKIILGQNMQYEKFTLSKHSVLYVDDFINLPTDTAGLELNGGAYIGGNVTSGRQAKFRDVIFKGDVLIGEGIGFTGDCFLKGNMYPRFSSNPKITVEGNFTNYGSVTKNANGYKLYFDIYGNLTNAGNWESNTIKMMGTGEHIVSTDPNFTFAPSFFQAHTSTVRVPFSYLKNSFGSLNSTFPFLVFKGTDVEIKKLILETGTGIYLTVGSKIAVGNLIGNGGIVKFIDNSYIKNYAGFGKTTMNNVVLTGSVGVYGNIFLNGEISLDGSIYPMFSSNPTVTINGNFNSAGSVQANSNGYRLYFNISGNLESRASWLSNQLKFTGTNAHTLYIDTTYTFSPAKILADSSSILSASDLKIFNSNVRIKLLTLQNGNNLYLDSCSYWGEITGGGNNIYMSHSSYFKNDLGKMPVIENVTFYGETGFSGDAVLRGNVFLNGKFHPQFSVIPTIYISGDFTNNGSVEKNAHNYMLKFNISGDLENFGHWESNAIRFTGTYPHALTTDTNYIFAPRKVFADSSSLVSFSHLRFVNSELRISALNLQTGNNVIMDSCSFAGKIIGNNNIITLLHSSYFYNYGSDKTEIENATLRGNIGMFGNMNMYGDIYLEGKMYPQFSSAPLIDLRGNFHNKGAVSPNAHNYMLSFKVSGDIESLGPWHSNTLTLGGTNPHRVVIDSNYTFAPSKIIADSSSIVSGSDLKFVNSNVQVMELYLNSENNLTLDSCKFTGSIIGNYNKIILKHSSYFYNLGSLKTKIDNAALHGKIGFWHNASFTGDIILFGEMYPQFSSQPIIDVFGNFYNHGKIKPNKNNYVLKFNVPGGINNDGAWVSGYVTFNGSADQYIGLADTSTFNKVRFESVITGSSYQWLKDGTPIAGATNSTLSLIPLTFADRGVYKCEINGGASYSREIIVDTVRTLLLPPILSAPPDLSLGVALTPTLTWSAVNGTAIYRAEVNTSADFTGTVIFDSSSITGTTVDVSGLDYNTTYYWRITAYSSQFGETSVSNVFSFTTMLAQPVLNTPSSGSGDISLTPKFEWLQVTGADDYRFELNKDSLFSSNTIVVDTSHIADTTFTYGTLEASTTYYWRVTAYNSAGNFSHPSNVNSFTTLITSVDNERTDLPNSYQLEQNYPNPFNPTTKIKFSIPAKTHSNISRTAQRVKLSVYDLLGRKVATLVNEEKQPGYYEVEFNASGISSGIYYYRIQAGEFVKVRKMILLK